MSRSLLNLLLVAGLAVATVGCSDDSVSPLNVEETQQSNLKAPVPHNDTEFIDGMGPHHQRAVMSTTMVIERGSRADVKAFAARIKAAQMAEIAEMMAARKELTGSETIPMPPSEHGDLDRAKMSALSGAELDTFFLTHMLAHHAGGVQMAHNALPNLKRADMLALATKIVDVQSAEIGEIRMLLGK